jgi:hypothetical protein
MRSDSASKVILALGHLEYSFVKIKNSELLAKAAWTEEDLEILESFSTRFARAADLIVSRLLRSMILYEDPVFQGSFLDLLNRAEKYRYIDSATAWYRIRQLRNVAAHEYATNDIRAMYQEVFALAPTILSVRSLCQEING